MFIPKEFDLAQQPMLWQLAEQRRFGSMVVLGGNAGAHSVHVPWLFDAGGTRLRSHIAARNPILSDIEAGASALVIFSCADAYISPRWYVEEADVPTWNYLVLEFEGTLHRLPHQQALEILSDSSAAFEHDIGSSKPTWTHHELLDQRLADHLARAIVGFELRVRSARGAAKLSQDKVETDLEAVMGALERSDRPAAQALSRLMRQLKPLPRAPDLVPSTMPPGY